MPEKKDFRDYPAYPVLFVIVLSLVFVGALAALYRLNEAGIETRKRETYERAILALCADSLALTTGRQAAEIKADYPASFNTYIKELPRGRFPRRTYSVRAGDTQLAWVFDINGKGLWGTMNALVATTMDKSRLIGIDIYQQVETPGLGSRITEDWFTGQFRRKSVIRQGQPINLELIPEGQEPQSPIQIRQVTGATVTSRAVLAMLRDELLLITEAEEATP